MRFAANVKQSFAFVAEFAKSAAIIAWRDPRSLLEIGALIAMPFRRALRRIRGQRP